MSGYVNSTEDNKKPRSTCLSLNPTAFKNDCALATLYPARLIFPEVKTTDLDFCNIATDTKQTAKEINVLALSARAEIECTLSKLTH